MGSSPSSSCGALGGGRQVIKSNGFDPSRFRMFHELVVVGVDCLSADDARDRNDLPVELYFGPCRFWRGATLDTLSSRVSRQCGRLNGRSLTKLGNTKIL